MYDLAENQNLCPCSRRMLYAECCQPFHEGRPIPHALDLMRSRYSAYALGFADYIIKTTHPGSPLYQFDRDLWKQEILKFSTETTFQKLEIREFTEYTPFSSVTFAAHLTKKKRPASFTEKSYFEFVKGRWLYRNGLVENGIQESIEGPGPDHLLPLAYLGEEVLLKKAAPIEAITDETRALVRNMQDTMDALNGIGLAAPQVHRSLRLFVIREPITLDDGEIDFGEFKVFINPSLENPDSKTETDYEACLSIPGIEAEVLRSLAVTVCYTDLSGNLQEERAQGLYARALMHEMDHLNGILFFDHLSSEQQKKIEPYLTEIKARFS